MKIDTCYDLALDYFADALSSAERLQIERHLCDDDALALHYARVQESLALATAPPSQEAWNPENASRVWDAIAQEESLTPSATSQGSWLMAATLILALGAGWFVMRPTPPIEMDAPPSASLEPAPTKARVTSLVERHASGLTAPVFVSPEASWSYDAKTHALHLDRGRALVEFVPLSDGAKLTVRTPDARVHVLGTVFSVEHVEGVTRVAVFEGEVEVARGDERVLVGKNERLLEGARVPMLVTQKQRDEVRRHIDLSAHNDALEQAKTKALVSSVALTPPSSPVVVESRKSAPSTVRQRMARAEVLMRRGDHPRAYRVLTAVATKVPARSARARAIQLDLARIAIRHLKDPVRAQTHLRVLVARWPNHPATAIVRRQLCTLSSCE